MNKLDITQLKEELWQCDDPRFPKTEDIVRVMPDVQFLESIAGVGQLQPIMMCHDLTGGGDWHIGFGRKRLLAIRNLQAANLHDGKVRVTIGENISPDDAEIISLIENAQRNHNKMGDHATIRGMLRKGRTFEEIAKAIGKPTSYIKQIDKEFSSVPTWAVNAVLSNKITLATAVGVGKLGPTMQKELKQEFNKGDKLTEHQVVAKRQFVQNNATAQVMPVMNIPKKREWFSREEVSSIVILLKSGQTEQALEVCNRLLA
jgi:ParB-like chromosome segregation protein Spo0J